MEKKSVVPTRSSITNATVDDDAGNESEYWIYTGFSVPLALGALYLSMTQIVYCTKSAILKTCSRWKRNSDTISSKRSREKHGTVLNLLSAIGVTCAFLRAGVDFRLAYGRYNNMGCDLAVKFKIANYSVALLCIYLVLWLRQRVFYQHPGLKHLSSRLIRSVSWFMCFVIICGLVGTTTVFFVLGNYYGTPQGCGVPTGPLLTIRWYVLIACNTTFQIGLLTLFIYPLAKHKSTMTAVGYVTRTQDLIIPLVKRATVTSISCIFSDIGFAILVMAMKRHTTTMTTFVYDVNVVFNAYCMILSFGNWRSRLMPWREFHTERQNSRNPSTAERHNHANPYSVRTHTNSIACVSENVGRQHAVT